MADRTCVDCGAQLPPRIGSRGRPRVRCETCSEPRVKSRACTGCGASIPAAGKWRCKECIEAETSVVRAKVKPLPPHGSASTYKNHGCRCEPCRLAANAEKRKGYQRRKAEGMGHRELVCEQCGSTYYRDKPTKYCGWDCYRLAKGRAPEHEFWINRDVRLAIYDRDGWRCKLCGEPLDMTALPTDPNAPTLDHVLPQAHGGTHHPDNLQAAHRGCNAAKGSTLQRSSKISA